MGAQPSSVFLTRGQSFRFQRWMASSSRSRARVSGFWRVQPRLCVGRPITSGRSGVNQPVRS
jgi:hypothetical protein